MLKSQLVGLQLQTLDNIVSAALPVSALYIAALCESCSALTLTLTTPLPSLLSLFQLECEV